MKGSLGDLIGGWAFLVGVILAAVFALFPAVGSPAVMTALVVIGLLIGLFNIGDREVTPFLFSGLVLVLVSSAGKDLMQSLPFVNSFLIALLAIFVPATVVVAVKNVFGLAKR